MSTTTTVGFGNPILNETVKRLKEEVEEFHNKCSELQKGLNRSVSNLGSLRSWGKTEHPRIIEAATRQVIDADIFLTPKEQCLSVQLSRTKSFKEISGAKEVDLEELKQLMEKVQLTASCVRGVRNQVKQQLAPSQTWSEWVLGSYSKKQFETRVLESTNEICDTTFPGEDPRPQASPQTPTDIIH